MNINKLPGLGMLAIALLTLLIVSCSDLTDYNAPVEDKIQFTHATINNFDGTMFGVTRDEYGSNGGYQVYDFGSGLVVGFIQPDTMVNDLAGIDLGLCTGATITDFGVDGDCILPKPEVVEPILPCPDTRDGTFPQSTNPTVCHDHGYFYCSVVGHCLNKPENVNICGEIGSEQRRTLNANK